MDNGLSSLTSVQHLSLSSNIIENVAGLERLTNLRVLSLARNNLKDLSGIEAVAGSLEQLWVSYNFIEKLKGKTNIFLGNWYRSKIYNLLQWVIVLFNWFELANLLIRHNKKLP